MLETLYEDHKKKRVSFPSVTIRSSVWKVTESQLDFSIVCTLMIYFLFFREFNTIEFDDLRGQKLLLFQEA